MTSPRVFNSHNHAHRDSAVLLDQVLNRYGAETFFGSGQN
jgi:hypothetical protein